MNKKQHALLESMDKKHIAILETIYENEGKWFGTLLKKTNKKIPISQRPFGRRLNDLQSWGYATKRGWSYFLDTPRIPKSDYSRLKKDFNKLRKKMNRILTKKSSFFEKFSLIKEIFYDWYVPIAYEKICLGSLLKGGEKFKINKFLNDCEKIIQKITKNLEKDNPGTSWMISHPEGVIFVEKVKKHKEDKDSKIGDLIFVTPIRK